MFEVLLLTVFNFTVLLIEISLPILTLIGLVVSACHSTSRYCAFLGHNLLSWSSKRHNIISHSSSEAEYRLVANVVDESYWIWNFLLELQYCPHRSTLVYYDNVNTVFMSSNPIQHQRTKHTEIDLHFVQDKVATCHVRVLHVPSSSQYADIFTKSLHSPLFLDFRSSLNVLHFTIVLTTGLLADLLCICLFI